MKLAVTLRNMGPQSSASTLLGGARHAEAAGLESVWITDHIAIPPDDAEGSDGRYTDPLTTLAWLGGATTNIGLGVGVLVLPYRPALPTAKQVATVQELTGNRLLLGVAVGWMAAEFKALGIDRRQRGALTDDVLSLMADAFRQDVVERHGQRFIFSPRPAAPPIYVGGGVPQALRRALRFGHGWLPMTRDPQSLAADLETYRQLADGQGTRPGPVTAMTGLPLTDPSRARDLLAAYATTGIERLVCAMRYRTLDDYRTAVDRLMEISR